VSSGGSAESVISFCKPEIPESSASDLFLEGEIPLSGLSFTTLKDLGPELLAVLGL